jgi:hypothetical protein
MSSSSEKPWKGSRHCAVVGCSNGDYALAKWKNSVCEKHMSKYSTEPCNCLPPFELYNFPTKKKNPDGRKKWIQLLNRSAKSASASCKMWSPTKGSRVCSEHFIDGVPSQENLFPSEKLGYDSKKKVANIINQRTFSSPPTPVAIKQKRRKLCIDVDNGSESCEPTSVEYTPNIPMEHEHSYAKELSDGVCDHGMGTDDINTTVTCISLSYFYLNYGIYVYVTLIHFLVYRLKCMNSIKNVVLILKTLFESALEENNALRAEVAHLKKLKQSCTCKKSLSEQLLVQDEDVKFYTGFNSKVVFEKITSYIGKYVRQLWVGPKHTSTKIKRKFKSLPKKFGPSRKLLLSDQFLLLMMKLRLNSPLKDLAKRFKISYSSCQRIFSSWSKTTAKVLRSLVFMPDQGILNATRPGRFSSFPNLNSIADCFEVFIQTPKDPVLQRLTWSSYKHHNTLKYFVSVAPNSMVVFLSKAYPGAISDKEITNQSRFLDHVGPYCSIMVDKGFRIAEECAARQIQLIIPPGKRGHSQMNQKQVVDTKEIARLRILVEQVIRRIRTFNILSHELPINLIRHADDIASICSAVSNLNRPIFK